MAERVAYVTEHGTVGCTWFHKVEIPEEITSRKDAEQYARDAVTSGDSIAYDSRSGDAEETGDIDEVTLEGFPEESDPMVTGGTREESDAHEARADDAEAALDRISEALSDSPNPDVWAVPATNRRVAEILRETGRDPWKGAGE